jgi:dUTP pyrophosphatase
MNVKKINPNAKMPTYATPGSAGMDLYACIDSPTYIMPGQTVPIPTGIAMEIPKGYVGILAARSGLSIKYGIAPANKIGVIDSDYRGEIVAALHNHNTNGDIGDTYVVNPNDRIAQLLIIKVEQMPLTEVTELSDTQRNTDGFGSTGK